MRTDSYRTRYARVQTYRNGRDTGVHHMCIAENLHVFLWGLIKIWWPVGEWRHNAHDARKDISEDIRLHQPLPVTTYTDVASEQTNQAEAAQAGPQEPTPPPPRGR